MGKVTQSSDSTHSKPNVAIWTERLDGSKPSSYGTLAAPNRMDALHSRGIGIGPALAGLPTSGGDSAPALRAVRHRAQFEKAHVQHSTRTISYSNSPPGALTGTTSPVVRPINALPIGLSLLIRPLFGSVSVGPTIVYSSSSS